MVGGSMVRYDIAVTTHILTEIGDIYADLGTMRWFGVNEDMRVWLAESCGITFRRMLEQPLVTEGERYTVRYRTVVTDHDTGAAVSDTGNVDMEDRSYASVIEFERWAIGQLAEMLDQFEAGHGAAPVIERRVHPALMLLRIVRSVIRGKRAGS